VTGPGEAGGPLVATGEVRPGSGQMFDRIARRYDLLNRLMSFGVDKRWRKRTVAALQLPVDGPSRVLDLATGTGDLAIDIARRHRGAHVIGSDPSVGMLDVGRHKIIDRRLEGRVELEVGDAQQLRFEDDSFDGCTIAFGIRNVPDRAAALREMARVVRPGGWVLAEFYNARSLRRLVKWLKPPTAVSAQTSDEAVYTRYDHKRDIASYLPPELEWVTSRGIRIITPVSRVHDLPVVGHLVRRAEDLLADQPFARDLGGFLVVVARRR
jgi:ubiquinone/menaquinone biosynthesis methyltransferase